jgi:hypothetical protein
MIGKDPADQANLHCDMGNATWTKALFVSLNARIRQLLCSCA